jgi:hypothetical protein
MDNLRRSYDLYYTFEKIIQCNNHKFDITSQAVRVKNSSMDYTTKLDILA